jgi:excisionase family DNA binding protein
MSGDMHMSIQSCGLSPYERLVVPPKQAWRMLGVSNSKGYELLAAGESDSIKLGRARRITIKSINRLIEKRLTGGKPEAA